MKMIFKIALFFAIVFGFPAMAMGQQYVQNISGVVAVPVSTGSSFKLILGANVTSFSFNGPPTSPGQIVTMYFLQDATGSRTVTFASNIYNSCTITSTAATATVCQFAYDQFSNSWFGIGASGGGGGFTAGGDLSGSSSSQEVIGILSHALPSLTTGFLNWTGSAWALSAAGSGTVTTSGSPASTYLASFTAGTVITGIAGAFEDGSGNLTAPSFNTSGSNGGLSGTEGTGSNCAIGVGKDCQYPDATLHCWHANLNNVDVGCGATASNTLTLTNKTFDTAGTGNVFKINGTGITAVSGTGAVCLASGSACGGGAGPNFTTPVTIAPPSGTTTSFINYPENTAGLGQQPLSAITITAATTIAATTVKPITVGSSGWFMVQWASGSATITSSGPNDSLGNAVTCSAAVTPGVISGSLCYFNNSGSAGSDTFTITFSASVTAWISGEIYTGLATSSVLDGSIVSASGNSSAPSSGAYTSTNANDLIVTAIGSVNYINSYALGGSFNERQYNMANGVSQDGGIIAGDQLASSTGSFTGSLTLPASLSGRWIAFTVGFKLSAAPAVADMGGNQSPQNYPWLNTDFWGNTVIRKIATQGAYTLAGPGGLPGGINFLSSQLGPCWIFSATTSDCLNASDGQLNWGNNINIQPGGGIFKGASANLNVATGTAPLTIASTTPVANLTTVPTTYNAAGTQQTGVHIVKDSGTLSGGTLVVTLTGSAAFTSSSTYSCAANDDTSGVTAITVVYTSGTSVTFNGTTSDAFRYVCVGN